MADIPTVTVTYTGSPGPVVINESDYDPAVHTLVGGEASTDQAAPKRRGRKPRAKAKE